MAGSSDIPARRLMIAGDSHIEAIKNALRMRKQNGHFQIEVLRLAKRKGGQLVGDMSYHDAVKLFSTLGPHDMVVLRALGTLHNVLGLIQHERPFDFFAPAGDAEAGAGGPALVPEAALRDMFASSVEDNQQVARLHQAAPRLLLLATPPPNPDNQWIMARLQSYRGRVTAQHGITPARLRLKLWQLEMDVVGRFCQRQGMRFVPPPPVTVSSDGFLKVEFRGDDATHANAAYGELVLQQLESIAMEDRGSPGGT